MNELRVHEKDCLMKLPLERKPGSARDRGVTSNHSWMLAVPPALSWEPLSVVMTVKSLRHAASTVFPGIFEAFIKRFFVCLILPKPS